MNYFNIVTMCKNITDDYTGMGRKAKLEDGIVLDTIMRMYNTTEIDWEEVKWLWCEYLEKGNLYIAEAIEKAKKRIMGEHKDKLVKIVKIKF